MITKDSALSLAAWLANDQPALFEALLKHAAPSGIAGFTDILSSIGSGIGGAVSSVGTYLTSGEGIKTLSTLAGTYMTSQVQKDALQVQLAQVRAGQTAQPIQTTYNPYTGQYEATLSTAAGNIPLTSQLSNQLRSSTVPAWVPWLLGGGGLLFLLLMFMPRGAAPRR